MIPPEPTNNAAFEFFRDVEGRQPVRSGDSYSVGDILYMKPSINILCVNDEVVVGSSALDVTLGLLEDRISLVLEGNYGTGYFEGVADPNVYTFGDIVPMRCVRDFAFSDVLSVGSLEGYQAVVPGSAQLAEYGVITGIMCYADTFGVLHPLRAPLAGSDATGLIIFTDDACAFEPSPVPEGAASDGFHLLGTDIPSIQFGLPLSYETSDDDITTFVCKGVELNNSQFRTVDSGDVSPYEF